MGKHNRYNHYWQKMGTLGTMDTLEIEELKKTHEVAFYNRRVMARKKKTRQLRLQPKEFVRKPIGKLIQVNDQSGMLARMKTPKRTFWQKVAKYIGRFWVVLAVWGFLFLKTAYKPAFYQTSLDGTLAKAIKLAPCYPCQFTEEELKSFEDKNRVKVAEAKVEKAIEKIKAPEDVEAVVRKYFGDVADKALICFKSESGLRPTAINYSNRNGTWDIGLAQINTVHCKKVNATNREDCKNKLLDLDTNVRIAKQIYDGRGFNAWYGKTCKQFWK